MNALNAAGIAERVRALVSTRDRGDAALAAGRLGVPTVDIADLDRVLAAGLSDDCAQDGVLRFLAAVTRGYQADPCWLLTGHSDLRRAELSPSDRLKVADLLLRLGDFLVRERAAHRLLHAQPWARAC